MRYQREIKEHVLNIIINTGEQKNERTPLSSSTPKHNIQQIIAAYPQNVSQVKEKQNNTLMAQSSGSACSFYFLS